MSAPAPDLLVIAASNGENLKLAQRFASQASALGHSADVLDLTTVDLPPVSYTHLRAHET